MLEKAVKQSSDELGSFWSYRSVSVKYDRQQREWKFVVRQPKGYARVYAKTRSEAMRAVDRFTDDKRFVAENGDLVHPNREYAQC